MEFGPGGSLGVNKQTEKTNTTNMIWSVICKNTESLSLRQLRGNCKIRQQIFPTLVLWGKLNEQNTKDKI